VSERGSATVELVLITPVLVLLMLFAVAAGRFSVARNQVNEAARDAAREASTWRSPGAASSHGVERGLASLAASRVSCRSPGVAIDTSGLRPGGAVVADVTCTVDLGDLLGLRLGGAKTFKARAVAVVDTFRSDG
jgi:Flp pilus assembly protein TadG